MKMFHFCLNQCDILAPYRPKSITGLRWETHLGIGRPSCGITVIVVHHRHVRPNDALHCPQLVALSTSDTALGEGNETKM